ncbi:Imm8 family immunity protein [Brevibacillus parabrevis]|uniref:Imm8 family immunity protein n=1 Tax=Brevibacillus parabrevis TaxID=54914 RepID=UPI003D1E2D78
MVIPIIKYPIDVTGEVDVSDDFWVSLCVAVGPEDSDGADFFYFYATSPKNLLRTSDTREVISGRGLLIVREFDLEAIEEKINDILKDCVRSTWDEVAIALNRYARWEYDEKEDFGE